jgi:hypothetical protein
MRGLISTAITMVSVLLIIVVLSIIPSSEDDNELYQYAALFPLNISRTEVFERVVNAQGVPVRDGIISSIIISASYDSNYSNRLYEQGALFVFKPIVRGACISQGDINRN